MDREKIMESLAPVEVNDICRLPENYRHEWTAGIGGLWLVNLSRVESDEPPVVFERWAGVVMAVDGWLRGSVDIAPVEGWAYVNGPYKLELAAAFVERYGGEAFFQAEPIDLAALLEQAGDVDV